MIPMIMGCCAQQNSIGDLNSTIVRVVSDGSQQLTVENQFNVVEFSVDWGDGNVESGGSPLVHTYLTPGEYVATVKLESSSGVHRNYGVRGNALVEVLQFDHSVTQTYFQLSPNLIKVPDRIPSSFTALNNTFHSCFLFNDAGIKNWNVSNISSMNGTLGYAMAFNQDLSGWCVSNFSTEPNNFSTGATSWVLPKPIWGTCPNG